MTNKIVTEYLREIGAKGGKAGTGKSKARPITSAQARKAVQARWKKHRLAKGTHKKK